MDDIGDASVACGPSGASNEREGRSCSSVAPACPPLVLVHGFAQSAHTWDKVARLLGEGLDSRRCSGWLPRAAVAVDLIGHGKALRPDDPAAYDIDAQVDALLAAMRAAGDGAPALVVGYSMGGRVALVAARRCPAAFAGLVLESAGLGPVDEADRIRLAQRNAAWAARLREEGVASFLAWWSALPLFASQQTLPAATRKAIADERAANDAEALARSLERAGAHAMPLAAEGLAALRGLAARGKLVGFIVGSQDEKYCAVARCVKDELVGFSSAHVSIVEGAGHNVHLERPEAFVQTLKAMGSAK